MPNWIPITIDTLNEAKVAALVEACDSAALAGGQSNRSAGLIQGVVNEVRNAVASCRTNQVDNNPTTIPASLRDLAVDLVLARLKNALEIELTSDERSNLEWRRKQLTNIVSCALTVEQPDTAVDPQVQIAGSVEVIVHRQREATRAQTSGLV